MLKRLAMLVSVIALASFIGIPASQNVPPNAPEKGVVKGDSTGKTKPSTEAQREDQSAAKVPSVVVQGETPSVESKRPNSHEDEATQKLVRFTFGLMVFTAGLVVVGFLQAIALILQVILLRRHAGHLENLSSAADASSKATTEIKTAIQKQAELMGKTLVLQFRPKVNIRFASASEFNLANLGKPATAKVRLNIVNSGGSPAHISVGKVALWWTEMSRSHSRKIEIHEGTERQLGEFTLQPGAQCRWEGTLDMNAINDLQWVNYHEGLATEDNRTLILVGGLYYTDDLSIPRSIGIHRNYDPRMMNFIAADDEGEYAD